MTAWLLELERITPTSVTTPVMHATMIDSIKNCLSRSRLFVPREAVSARVASCPRGLLVCHELMTVELETGIMGV